MCRTTQFLLPAAILLISLSANAQIYTVGRENGKAEVNFTEVANYAKTHPEPKIQRPLFDEDEEENEREETDDTDTTPVHLIHRLAARTAGAALLPASPAPNDTFIATTTDGTAIPPDTHGEVDSNYVVTVVNTQVRIQNKTGGTIRTIPIDTWWRSVLPHGTGGASFDPRVHYDPHFNRWIMVCDAYGQSTHSQIMIAVSQTGDPTGTWNMFYVVTDPTGQSWLDYPVVGFNKKWITVTGNFFQNTSGTGVRGAVAFVFDYDSLMTNTSARYTKISESSEFTLSPALTYDTAETSLFLVDVNRASSGRLKLFKITGPVDAPVIATVGTPTTTTHWQDGGNGDFQPQLGTTNLVQAGDQRITHFVCRNNNLWLANTVFLPATGTRNRCSVMWWQIDTSANPIQNGLIDDPATPSFYSYPTIAVNKNNDLLIGYSLMSANTYPDAAYSLHVHTDPADSMRPSHIYRHGLANYYQIFGGTQNRWGDYSNTCVDPVNGLDFWTIQETVPASPVNYWSTWWAYVAMCPAQAAFSVTKDTVVKGALDTLTFTGAAPAGTTYTWSFGGGTGSPGTGAGPQVVKWVSGTDGFKGVTLTVTQGGCSTQYTDSIYLASNVAVNQLTLSAKDIEVAPNPNDGSFNILFGTQPSSPVSVRISDMQGRVVYDHKFDNVTSSRIPINTEALKNGNYILVVNDGGADVSKTVTITR